MPRSRSSGWAYIFCSYNSSLKKKENNSFYIASVKFFCLFCFRFSFYHVSLLHHKEENNICILYKRKETNICRCVLLTINPFNTPTGWLQLRPNNNTYTHVSIKGEKENKLGKTRQMMIENDTEIYVIDTQRQSPSSSTQLTCVCLLRNVDKFVLNGYINFGMKKR